MSRRSQAPALAQPCLEVLKRDGPMHSRQIRYVLIKERRTTSGITMSDCFDACMILVRNGEATYNQLRMVFTAVDS